MNDFYRKRGETMNINCNQCKNCEITFIHSADGMGINIKCLKEHALRSDVENCSDYDEKDEVIHFMF